MKRNKRTKKDVELIIVGMAVSGILTLIIFNKPIINFWYELGIEQECIKEKEKIYSPIDDYYRKSIIVVFSDNSSSDRIENLIKDYGLEIQSLKIKGMHTPETFARISVPIGSEINWICKFESNDIVKRALLTGVAEEHGYS